VVERAVAGWWRAEEGGFGTLGRVGVPGCCPRITLGAPSLALLWRTARVQARVIVAVAVGTMLRPRHAHLRQLQLHFDQLAAKFYGALDEARLLVRQGSLFAGQSNARLWHADRAVKLRLDFERFGQHPDDSAGLAGVPALACEEHAASQRRPVARARHVGHQIGPALQIVATARRCKVTEQSR